jgi:hypothetical protein
MSLFTAPLYAAKFDVPGWVQFWYSFQTTVAMSMGMLGFAYPNTPAITTGGYWQYLGEKDEYETKKKTDDETKKIVVLAPNVRGWGLRNAIPALVNIMAFYFGTKETYLIMTACALWRETFDIIEAFIEDDTDKVFYPTKVPAGKFPPLGYFPPYLVLMVGNLATLYAILTAP